MRLTPVRVAAIAAVALTAVVVGGTQIALAVTLSRDPKPKTPGTPTYEITDGVSRGNTLVVFYSGDNGWAKADQGFSGYLAQNGAPVVGIDSLRYFLQPRTPDSAAADLARLIDRYSTTWRKPNIILAGYSYGGSNLPAIVLRLPVALQRRIKLIALIAPGENARLKFDLGAWLDLPLPGATSVASDIRALPGIRTVCVSGVSDKTSACHSFPAGLVPDIQVPGDHRYKGAYEAVAQVILAEARPHR